MTVILCQARACDRPVDGVSLCGECRDELVDALRALVTGGVLRIRVHVVDHREGEVAEVADERPGLLADLEITLTRQHRLGGAGVPTAGGSEPPVPFHQAASDLAHDARNTIGTWARNLADLHPHLTLPTTHQAAAAWLATFPGLLAEHPAAGEMHQDITSLVRRIRRMVDRPADRVYLGMCSARLEQLSPRKWRLCEVDVYAARGKDVVQCPACGATHDVSWRRDRMLLRVDGQLATATDASRALSAYDCPVTAGHIRMLASRGKLTPRPPHPDDPRKYPRYRIGDIRKLIAEAEAEKDGGSAA